VADGLRRLAGLLYDGYQAAHSAGYRIDADLDALSQRALRGALTRHVHGPGAARLRRWLAQGGK
jgi:hypothetical protein